MAPTTTDTGAQRATSDGARPAEAVESEESAERRSDASASSGESPAAASRPARKALPDLGIDTKLSQPCGGAAEENSQLLTAPHRIQRVQERDLRLSDAKDEGDSKDEFDEARSYTSHASHSSQTTKSPAVSDASFFGVHLQQLPVLDGSGVYESRVFRLVSSLLVLAMVVFLLAAIVRLNESPIEDEEYDDAVAELETIESTVFNDVFGFSVSLEELDCPGASTCEECVTQRAQNRAPTLNPQRRLPSETTCALTLPSVDQVQSCRSTNETLLEFNALYFEPACLTDTESCPNCDLLAQQIEELRFGRSPSNSTQSFTESLRYVQLAELYIQYKAETEASLPEKYFSWEGSVYFAATVATTIGYGNFTPTTDESKWAICFLVIPCLALFGFALSQFAELILDLSRAIANYFHPMKYDYPNKHAVRNKIIDFIRDSYYQNLRQRDVIAVFDKYNLIPKDPAAKIEAELHIRNLFSIMDTAGEDSISKGFILTIVMEYYEDYEDKIERAQAKRELIISLTMSVLFLLAGTAFFYESNRDKDWSGIDAFYFSMITLTTIGFGDFTPDAEEPEIAFWFFYIVFGLGLLGALISSSAFFVSEWETQFDPGTEKSLPSDSFIEAVRTSQRQTRPLLPTPRRARLLSRSPSRGRRSRGSPSRSPRRRGASRRSPSRSSGMLTPNHQT